jgi:hypothetical protein
MKDLLGPCLEVWSYESTESAGCQKKENLTSVPPSKSWEEHLDPMCTSSKYVKSLMKSQS